MEQELAKRLVLLQEIPTHKAQSTKRRSGGGGDRVCRHMPLLKILGSNLVGSAPFRKRYATVNIILIINLLQT